MTPIPWKLWEGQVLDLCLPLRRYLGGTDTTAVYLTQTGDTDPRNAAVKLVLADPHDDGLLSQWDRAGKLSHPNLLGLWHRGTCQVNQHTLHYVVTEYAEENLADVLADRALSPAEVREILPPLLDALAYIHSEGLVHGHLKPGNIMAVADQLKLSVDGITAVGDLEAVPATPGRYDAPEFPERGWSPMGDVWSFGMTLVEALTQRLPRLCGPKQEPALPDNLPAEFVPIVRACLQPDPRKRATLSEARDLFGADLAAIPSASPAEAAPVFDIAEPAPRRRWLTFAAIGGVAAIVAVIALSRGKDPAPTMPPDTAAVSSAANPETAAPASPSAKPGTTPLNKEAVAAPVPVDPPPSEPPSKSPEASATKAEAPAPPKGGREVAATSVEVVKQVMPDVTAAARRTIHGKVKISIRASADASGHVTATSIDSQSSQYFAKLAQKAAEQWTFAAQDGGSEWMLRFQMASSGDDVKVSKMTGTVPVAAGTRSTAPKKRRKKN